MNKDNDLMEYQMNNDEPTLPATILIADDEPTNVAVLQGVLESAGYQLMVAGNGREALDCLTDTIPDLILLDLMMPEIDGFEVCQQMKTTPQWRDIPVIIISALEEIEDYTRAMDCGADDYLTKPVSFPAVLERVQVYLSARADRHDLRKSEDLYQRMIECAPDAIMVECEGEIVVVNAAGVSLLGAADTAQLLDRPLHDLVHPSDRHATMEYVQRVQQTDAAGSRLRQRLVRLDHGEVEVEMSAAPFMYRGKQAVLMVVRADI